MNLGCIEPFLMKTLCSKHDLTTQLSPFSQQDEQIQQNNAQSS